MASTVLCRHHVLPFLPLDWTLSCSKSSFSSSFIFSKHLTSLYSSSHHHHHINGQSSFCSHYNKRHSERPGLLHSSVSTSQAMVAFVQDLFDFICTGPLLGKLGLTLEIVAESIDRWLEYGSYLCRLFGMNELDLPISEKISIYHYYIPVFGWCQMEILSHKSKLKDGEQVPPLVIGVSAPQGSGKATLVFALDYVFRGTGSFLILPNLV